MTASLQLASTDRLLVFAPHPDDETLATGELIQSALAAAAAVRVVFATNGDNNPWPQRWLERRWRIGTGGRRRWGERRRREATAALAVLGVAAEHVRFLDWQDQGLTDGLMRDERSVATLVAELSGFAPTHVAMPALGDRHPDHSALRVMLELALPRAAATATRLGYIVHGPAQVAGAAAIPADPVRQIRKRQALLAHASQIALSRRRLLDLATRTERFDITVSTEPSGECIPAPVLVSIPHRPGWSSWRRHDLLVVAATNTGTFRFRGALPRFPRRLSTLTLVDAHGQALCAEWDAAALRVRLPAAVAGVTALYAKLDRAAPRLVIFDREQWHDARALLPDGSPAGTVARRTAPGLA